MNKKFTAPRQTERLGIESVAGDVVGEVVAAGEELRAGMAECSEELRAGMAECSEELRAGMAECSAELREAETLAEKLRTEAVARTGEFAAQLASQADAIAALRATVDDMCEAAAAAEARADASAILLRQELESLKGLVEERHVDGAKYADAARAVMARAMQISVNAQQAEQHRLEADVGRLDSEVEEIRGRLELPAAPRPDAERPKQKKKKTKR